MRRRSGRLAAHVVNAELVRQVGPRLAAQGQLCLSAFGTQLSHRRIKRAAAYGLHILALDLKNAFNAVSRDAILRALDALAADADNPVDPALLALTRRLYTHPTMLRVTGTAGETISSRRGVVQGCPLSMTLFALALAPAVEQTRADLATNGFSVRPMPADPTPRRLRTSSTTATLMIPT